MYISPAKEQTETFLLPINVTKNTLRDSTECLNIRSVEKHVRYASTNYGLITAFNYQPIKHNSCRWSLFQVLFDQKFKLLQLDFHFPQKNNFPIFRPEDIEF